MIYFVKFLQFIYRIIFLIPGRIPLYFMWLGAQVTYLIVKLTPVRGETANNFRLFFPTRNCEQLADKLLKNTAFAIFEILCTPFFRPKHKREINEVINIENVEEGLKEGKGVLMPSIHSGNYEIVPTALAHKNFKMTGILRATEDPLFEIVNKARSANGMKLVNVLEKDMYQKTLKALKENNIICTLLDTGALESKHEMMPLLGQQVPVATGWLTLAQRSGCFVVPTIIWKEGSKNHIKYFDKFQVTSSNRLEQMERLRKAYEDFIKEKPEQWAIFLNSYEVKRMVGQ